MPEYKLRYEDEDTGCIYCWDEEKERWVTVCPTERLPPKIRQRILDDRQRAELVLMSKI